MKRDRIANDTAVSELQEMSVNNANEINYVVQEKTDIMLAEKQPEAQVLLEYQEVTEPQLFNIKTLENNIGEALSLVDNEVMHSYVTELTQLPLVAPSFDEAKIEKEPYQFFHITKLVYEQEEFSVSKLSTVFQSVSGKNSTLVLIVRNENHVTNFYLGVRNHDEKDFTGTLRQMLEMSLKGQFPGSTLNESFSIENIQAITNDLNNSTKSVSCVTCIPDYKQERELLENKDFLQGLEKFVISMQDKEYTAVFVADAIPYDELHDYRHQLESVYTQLSAFTNMQYQYATSTGNSIANTTQEGKTTSASVGVNESEGTNQSESQSVTEGTADTVGEAHTEGSNESVADGKTHGVTETTGESQSVTDGITKTNTVGVHSSTTVGANVGGNLSFAPFGIGGGINAGVSTSQTIGTSYSRSVAKSHSVTKGTNHSTGISDSVSKTLTKGTSASDTMNKSHSTNQSASNTKQVGSSKQHGTSSTFSEAFNLGYSDTYTNSFGSSQSITLQTQNMMIDNMLERIKRQITRINESESLGMWNCAAYFMGENRAISETAAHTYRSLISGKNSGVERSAVNTWSNSNDVEKLNTYLTHFCHPKFVHHIDEEGTSYFVSPASLISTKELAIQLSFPRKSICGLPVAEHAVFGQEIVVNKKDGFYRMTANDNSIELGNVFHLSQPSKQSVNLDIDSLTMHTFITGSTGSGKSNAVYHILDSLIEKKKTFLVIEPAKGEYRHKFKNASTYSTNPCIGMLLKLNPFSFPKGIHIQEHIDRLIELFNVCWPMYAAMPAVLKDSVIKAYESAGWDLMQSENNISEKLFPTFEDVLTELENVVKEANYSADTSSDYKGALKTRLKSLTNGINGMIFSSNEIPYENLFDKNAIVDLSRVGSMETKALLMGILVLKLQEYRMTTKNGTDNGLEHVTVIEEAHNLLKRTSTEQSQETANVQGKSVEMLTNAIAEMRTFGEGFIIVDQAPDLLDTAVIRNTNTKIVLRLPEEKDREATGRSMGLSDEQIVELSKLPTGVAAVYQNNWQETVLCCIKKYNELGNVCNNNEDSKQTIFDERHLLKLLLSNVSVDEIKREIVFSNAPSKVRRQLITHFEAKDVYYEWAMADYIAYQFNWKYIFNFMSKTEKTIDALGDRMHKNVAELFPDFSEDEINRICYYICRKAYESYPEHSFIENIRVEYFKKRW